MEGNAAGAAANAASDGARPRGGPNRGRGRGRGGARGRGVGRGRGRGDGGNQARPATTTETETEPQVQPQVPSLENKPKEQDASPDDDNDAEICFICANDITHRALTPCNHDTCHICSLRMRALYKDKTCPHCRTQGDFVVFTDDKTKRFEEYKDGDYTTTDVGIGIKYTSEDIVGDTVLLLRYNCPDPSCDFAGLSWPNLHQHVRTVHHKKMCDLCTRNKKLFTHEHDMYTDKELGEHIKFGDTNKPGALTGFKGHPLCKFCGTRFYDDDQLYKHCREKHERCHICDQRDPRNPAYYVNYEALEQHFKEAHYVCNERECVEEKFAVFESKMALQAHQVERHARRDARAVDMSNFDFRQSYEQERRGPGGGRDQHRRRPDPNAEPLPVSSAQPLRRDELAFQRQMAINQSSQSRPTPPPTSRPTPPPASRPTPTPASRPSGSNSNQPSQTSRAPPVQSMLDAMDNISIRDLSSLTQEQRATHTRHSAVIERAFNLLGSNPTRLTSFRSYISNYNKGSMTPDQVINSFFTLFSETSSTQLGTLIREVADLFEDKNKAQALRRAWQNYRAVSEDYPSLPSLGGMRGQTTSSSGWASAVTATPQAVQSSATSAAQARAANRVLKLKNSTRRGSIGSVVSHSSTSTANPPEWQVVGGGARPSAPVTASSAAFPALPSASASSSNKPKPSWIGGSASSTPATTTARKIGASMGSTGGLAASSSDAFPALPPAAKPAPPPIFGYGRGVLRREVGGRDTGFSWGAGGSGSGQNNTADPEEEEDTAGKGKKKKGKQKVRLMF